MIITRINTREDLERKREDFKAALNAQRKQILICGGAGQPEGFLDDKKKRASGLYTADKSALVKRSDENPVVNRLYEDGILKDRAHELLHVHYHTCQ